MIGSVGCKDCVLPDHWASQTLISWQSVTNLERWGLQAYCVIHRRLHGQQDPLLQASVCGALISTYVDTYLKVRYDLLHAPSGIQHLLYLLCCGWVQSIGRHSTPWAGLHVCSRSGDVAFVVYT